MNIPFDMSEVGKPKEFALSREESDTLATVLHWAQTMVWKRVSEAVTDKKRAESHAYATRVDALVVKLIRSRMRRVEFADEYNEEPIASKE